MSVLLGKTIVAGICGGIAAYKAAGVISSLQQLGADVRVIMTSAACEFVTPLTLESLSGHRVLTDLFRDEPLAHVQLAHKADLVVVMPATYDIIGKIAHGMADDYVTTVIAATRAPVLFVPAMESQMYENLILQENKGSLEGRGYRFLEPGVGHLASGRSGMGRFPAEEKILRVVEEILTERSLLSGWQVLVTAGPTRERIDPMRCVTNRSSGKMGYALAETARDLGAKRICLISGPTQLVPPAGVEFVSVESAEDMRNAVLRRAASYDAVLMAAAVADWRPKHPSQHKEDKRTRSEMTLVLEKTPDILKELGAKLKGKRKRPLLVGFAAETRDLMKKARAKLDEKHLDLVVANDVSQDGIGPESNANVITLVYCNGKSERLPQNSKCALAKEVWKRIHALKKRL